MAKQPAKNGMSTGPVSADSKHKSTGKKPQTNKRSKNKNKTKAKASSSTSRPKVTDQTEDDGGDVEWSSMALEELLSVAKAFEQMGSFDAAINAYTNALTHQPSNVELMLALAEAHTQLEQFDQATDYLAQATAKHQQGDSKQDTSVLFRMAICYEKQSRWDQAIAKYQQALQQMEQSMKDHEPGSAREVLKEWTLTLASLANCFGAKEDLDGAIEVYRRAVETQPSNGNLHFNLATLLMAGQSVQQAADHYEKAIELTEKEQEKEQEQQQEEDGSIQQEKKKELYEDLLTALEELARKKPKQATKRLRRWQQRYEQSFGGESQ